MKISNGKQVTLHFALKLEDGQVVDSTFDKKPATLVIGDGNLPGGFESYLMDLEAGAKETLWFHQKMHLLSPIQITFSN